MTYFGFKLFSNEGHLKFVSDENVFNREGGVVFNDKALRVFQTGVPNISVHDGTAKTNRPDHYVEAYLPAVNLSGQQMGVVEVYVNVTALSQVLHNAMIELSSVLILGSALIFSLPSIFVIINTRKMHERDKQVLELSRFDHLTGILNRNALTEEVHHIFPDRKAYPSIGILFFDLDKFKQINDTYGHDKGDQLLCHIASIISQNTRKNVNIVGRFGGDEFVVISFPQDEDWLNMIASRILTAVRQPIQFDGDTIHPTMSVGAYISDRDENENMAMKCADKAVYEAKRRGRNQIVSYSEIIHDHEQDALAPKLAAST